MPPFPIQTPMIPVIISFFFYIELYTGYTSIIVGSTIEYPYLLH